MGTSMGDCVRRAKKRVRAQHKYDIYDNNEDDVDDIKGSGTSMDRYVLQKLNSGLKGGRLV